jgi:hypothetical protein
MKLLQAPVQGPDKVQGATIKRTCHKFPGNKKRVTFDLSQSKLYESKLFEDETKKQWYSTTEISKFRNQTCKLVAAANNSLAFSYVSVIRGTYQACCKVDTDTDSPVLNPVQQDCLNQCAGSFLDLHGLDKYIKNSPTKRHKLHCEGVLEVQRMDWDEYEQPIFDESRYSSRASRLYAIIIAQVQMEVDFEDDEPAPVVRGLLPKIGVSLRRPLFSLAKNTRGGTAA